MRSAPVIVLASSRHGEHSAFVSSARLAVLLFVLMSCTNDVGTTDRASTVLGTQPGPVDSVISTAGSEALNCDGPIQQLAAPLPEYQSIGDSVALETSATSSAAFQTASRPDNPAALRLASKTGLVVRIGAITELIVPDQLLGHLAFQWNIPRPTSHLLIGPCPGDSNWVTFPGGYLVSDAGCYDFIARTADGDHHVSVGIGAPCPGQTPPIGYTES